MLLFTLNFSSREPALFTLNTRNSRSSSKGMGSLASIDSESRLLAMIFASGSQFHVYLLCLGTCFT